MIQIGARFKLRERSHAYLSFGAPSPFGRRVHKEITLQGFDVRLEIGGRIYELPTRNAPGDDGLRSRGLAFVRQIVPLTRTMSLEQQILLPNAGDAVAVSWRLLGEKITPVRLTATPIFSSAELTSSKIFSFDALNDDGRLTWMPFRRACKIIEDTNGYCARPSTAIDFHGQKNSLAPSAFVFDLGRHPSLLLISLELPTNSALDPLMGAFLADLTIPRPEQHRFLSAA